QWRVGPLPRLEHATRAGVAVRGAERGPPRRGAPRGGGGGQRRREEGGRGARRVSMSAERDKGADVWTIRRLVAWASDDLKKRGSPSPRLDVELLLTRVTGLDRVHLIVDADRPLSKDELARYRELHTRRRAGEPIAYLLGAREFYGRTFVVDRRVLVP